MAKRKSSNPLKKTNFFQYKASQARSSWRTRAKKFGLNLDEVPTRVEIQEWLEAQDPIRCYLSGSFISNEVMELDHKTPLSRQGSLKLENCGITSRYFNNVKGTMTEKEFRSLLKTVSKWADKGDALFKRLMASNHIYRKR
jgi:5-methylcytosine-specific restriction endonuclease McrA